jgi:sigma-E factor negative regulatory protein RseA
MHEEINQKISTLVDGELGYSETLELLKKMQSDEALKHKMGRYQAISEALKTDTFYQVSPDFSCKVFQEIQQEPAYFLPKVQKQSDHTLPSKQQPYRNKLFALAASLLVVAAFVGQGFRNELLANKPRQTSIAMASAQSPLPVPRIPPAQSTQHKQKPLTAQFNDYLQAHNNSVYTNGEANFQPYAAVTSYGRD